MQTAQLIPWVLFTLFIVAMLAIDLGIFNRKDHEVKVKEALVWSGVGLPWRSLLMPSYTSGRGRRPRCSSLPDTLLKNP